MGTIDDGDAEDRDPDNSASDEMNVSNGGDANPSSDDRDDTTATGEPADDEPSGSPPMEPSATPDGRTHLRRPADGVLTIERDVLLTKPDFGWRRTALTVATLLAMVGFVGFAVSNWSGDPDAARFEPAAPTTDAATTSTSTTTSTTTTTTAPPRPIDLEEPGQGCTQLANKGYSYADALSYWLRNDRPERMDPDADEIPCESNYSTEEKNSVWAARRAAGEWVPDSVLE